MLPNLSRLKLHDDPIATGICQSAAAVNAARAQWLAACGKRPVLKQWDRLSGSDKRRLLHDVAMQANVPGGAYLTAYEQRNIADVMREQQYSSEHVVPRSHVNGNEPGAAENDMIGLVEATRASNSRRSNYPLVLWPDEPGTMSYGIVRIDGEIHFAPPSAQRGRLARKWLFVRATYTGIQPPSAAQQRHASEIVALAHRDPPSAAELRVHDIYKTEFGWFNPLLEPDASRFYDSASWRALVFGPYACE